MDFLKVIMAYLALMSMLAVQEGPLPETVPTPTPLPEGVVATAAPLMTEVPTATPGPTEAPAPTITPNARYETIRYQDRGTHVRRMQNRLIELGYLPAGSADGAYGYQTYNAVREFQRRNGLGADGVAGPATLTNLYENREVRTNHTATPAPTATATPTIPPLPTPTLTPEVVATLPVPQVVITPAPDEIALPEAPTDVPAEPAAPVFEGVFTLMIDPSALGLTQLEGGVIISGNTGEKLTITQLVDDLPVLLRPALWMNTAGDAVISLQELADAQEGWELSGANNDYVLRAAGYEVRIHCTDTAVMVTVDGVPAAVTTADVQLAGGVLYVTDDFLETTLGATTVFSEEESSLVIFLLDKSLAQSAD